MSRKIRLENVTKRYRNQSVLHVDLTIPAGKFFALLGPSGCGKTTLLRLIAGFEFVDQGKIFLDNEEITHQPINQRHIHTVFQKYALFPHLNVFENVAYSQVIKKVPAALIKERVLKILHTMDLQEHAYKSISQLSGGQQQRVALARALINEPAVLLLDEPLAALDLKLREKMLVELVDLQSKLEMTFVYVTHDQFEALTVADQMAIMNHQGRIEQIGTPKEIYEFPVSTFVARFVGTTNIMQGTLKEWDAHDALVEVDNIGLFRVFVPSKKTWMQEGKEVFFSVRPEKILISKKPVENFSNQLFGSVEAIIYHGRSTQYNVRLNNSFLMQVFEQNEEHFQKDSIDYQDNVVLHWQKENAILLER